MKIASRGATMAVDWEQRIDFAKLRSDRLQRAQASLRESELGALLLFDQNNIRYVTSTHIGEWARDKSARCVLLARHGDPVLWDFGSAARHHQLYAPWLPESSWRAGVTSMRGAMPQQTGVPDLLLHPVDHAFCDVIDSVMGYRTCYYRSFCVGSASHSQLDAYKRCPEWLDAAIELVRPGVTTDAIAAVWPSAQELGFASEEA